MTVFKDFRAVLLTGFVQKLKGKVSTPLRSVGSDAGRVAGAYLEKMVINFHFHWSVIL